MRRHADFSPSPRRSRDRSVYEDRRRSASPRRPHSNRYKSSKFSHSKHHSPRPLLDRKRESSLENFRILCIRNFSSKLSSEFVKQCLFKEFGKYGDLSVCTGRLRGERIAFVTFKYVEDAREAFYARTTFYLHDRSVIVSPTLSIPSDFVIKKTSNSGTHHRVSTEDPEHLRDRSPLLHDIPSKLDPNFAGFSTKPPSLGASGSTSLLGMPGITSSAMMAAAARALGLTSVPPIVPPPLNSILPFERIGQVGTRHKHNRGTYSPSLADSDAESKATRTLFVGSLEPDITEEEVLKAFGRYGFVEQIDIKRSPKPGVHSYAFVRYQNVDMAARAKLSMSGRIIRTQHCKIGFGKPILSQCIYVSGMDSWKNSDTLHSILTKFGQLLLFDWVPGRKYAIALFDSCESAFEANNYLKALPTGSRSRPRLRVDYINPDFVQTKNLCHTLGSTDPISIVGANDQLDGQNVTENKVETDYDDHGKHMRLECDYLLSERHSNMLSRQLYRFNDHFQNSRYSDPLNKMRLHLKSIVNLKELDECLQPDLWSGQFLLKNSHFYCRCLFLTGNKDIGKELINLGTMSNDSEKPTGPALRISRRGNLNPTWMAEATHRIQAVLSTSENTLCLMLILPDMEKTSQCVHKKTLECNSDQMSMMFNGNVLSESCLSLHILVAYFKLKQVAGVIVVNENNKGQDFTGKNKVETHKFHNPIVYLFAPSSFALSLLKQVAPQLRSDLATSSDYMVLLAVKR